MATQRTLSIIKPDGIKKNVAGKIIAMFEEKGLRVVAAKRVQLTKAEAEGFYAVHRQRPFFGELVTFMMSGPVLLMVLEGDDAIAKNREIMGATDPAKATAGTIRKLYAASIGENTVHGSDAPETAKFEIGWFFAENEILS
ncbi:MAG: nucleoside-diphosphate kinase [Deltaproteobacteria bacterium]|nr:nucleoside-diphosphate kinase [Deltaproteobacteria bacterium]